MQGINTLLSSLVSMLQNMEIQDPGTSRQFTVGERLEAQVLSREGNNYLVQSGARLFRAQSDLNLPQGENLFLYVSEQKGDKTILRIELPVKIENFTDKDTAGEIKTNASPNEPEQVLGRVRQLAAKYGFTGEKELSQLVDQLARLPVDEKTGVRYLLDPHLATVVIIPDQARANHQAKIEIEQYKQAAGRQRVWEVSFDLSLVNLGPLEIVMKMIDGRIYARIWAEQSATEALLRARQTELDLQTALVEIVPVTGGPLLPRDTEEIIDMHV